MAFLLLAAAAPGAAPLRNGGFEATKTFRHSADDAQAAKPFPGWDCLGGWPGNVSVGREAAEGNRSAFFAAPCWMSQPLWLEPGKRYRLDGSFRTQLQEFPESLGFGAYFELRSGKDTLLRRSLSGLHDWTRLDGQFAVPPGDGQLTLDVGLKNAAGLCWADGFSIVEIDDKGNPQP